MKWTDPTGMAGKPAALTGAAQSAYDLILAELKSEGLESLAPALLDYLKRGYDPGTVGLYLQETPEYKARFAGNDARVKNGLAPLAPAEYLATEAAYRQALSAAGLPASFYDSRDDFAKFIGEDKSPAEIKRRADAAMEFVQSSDPAYLKAFQDYYGAGPADVAAYFLDGAKNEALLDRRASAARIGAAAAQQGLTAPNAARAERFAEMGVDGAQARQGYANVAQVVPGESAIAQRFGDQYDQATAEDEFLGGLASARRKRETLNQKEGALFQGSSGLGQSGLKQTGGY